MAPYSKRKRPDRSEPNETRPSPHRPQNLGLAHAQSQQQNNNAQGGRRGSRNSGRGGGPSAPNSPSVAQPSPSTMAPPTPSTTNPQTRSQLATASASAPSNSQAPASAAGPPAASGTPANSTISASARPSPSNASDSNQYVTSQHAASWNAQGRTAVIQAGTQAVVEGDTMTLGVVFAELIQACIDRVLDPNEIGSTVRQILAVPSSSTLDISALFVDTLGMLTETGTTPESLRPMLEAADIDPMRLRTQMDSNFLQAMSLVRSQFPRVAIRKATHALYRQSNYNLLREESEGYSKLITQYFTTAHSEPPSEDVATDTFQRVNALIGAFDLDVGRVLDVTLDVFANLLVRHYRFFIKFLRASSWWPEKNVPHGIEWDEPMVSTLPQWATPGFALWYYTDEQKDQQLELRKQRDVLFWKQVDKEGIGAYFQLGARRITSGAPEVPTVEDTPIEDSASPSEKKLGGPSEFEKIQQWSKEWMATTKTLPPSGNRIAAQLLGFKLRFYASDARDVNDTLPDNLIVLAALLIKIGFISLADLYPHLYPSDEDMPAQREKLMKAKKDREASLSGVSSNALAMAGALSDDSAPHPAPVSRLRESESKAPSKPASERGTPSATEEDSKDKLPDPVDQKVALLRSLLCIGAIPEALFILSRFPWLLDVYPDLHTYMFRIAHHSLENVYDLARPFSEDQVSVTPKQGSAAGPPRSSDYSPRRTLRWAKPDEKDAGDGIDYRFYWDDWADNVPVCQDVDDVFRLCGSWLKLVGLECGKDATLLTKLARIGKKNLAEDPSPVNLKRWTTLSATFLGPALTFSGRNPGVVNEVWDLFKNFDTPTRYSIYANWFTGPAKRQPAVQTKFSEITTETRRLFGRISKENTREMGRLIAKPAYACPGVVFEKALNTAENYANMTDPLVECCRYLTLLGYDCLNWTFINSFKEVRPTVQGDGMLAKPWLKNASFFIGKAYRRYSLMDPTPILQFVADQLLRGQLFTMEILEQLVTSMAGIGPVLPLTESQVYGLSGGPLLRAFTLEHYLGDKRHLAQGTAKRLLKCLKEAGLAAQILVALAIELERYVYRPEFEEAHTPLKVIGANLDRLHSNFTQYLDFLRTSLSIQDFDAIIPGVVELMSVYGVSPEIAFAICRPSLSVHINAARAEKKRSTAKSNGRAAGGSPTNGDVAMGGVEDVPAPNGTAVSGEDVTMKDVSAEDVEMKDASKVESSDTSSALHHSSASLRKGSNARIESLVDGLRTTMPERYGNHTCLNFYVTFWQLSLPDVFTVTRMKEMNEYTAAWKFYAEKANKVPYDRRDISPQAAEKRRAEVQQYNDRSAALRTETKQQLEAALKMREHLQEEMHQWFEGVPMVDAKSEDLHDTVLQDCFLPRILLSSQDAQFAAAMLKFMHEVGVPGFRTMKFLDQLFKHRVLSNIIFMCSERESSNLGRFLNDILKELNVWHASQSNYTKFSQGLKKNLPGFGRTFNPDRTPATFLDYEDFRRLLCKWHTQMFKALETCLKTDEYMNIRNAINVLKAIAPSFPKIDSMGKSLFQLVQELSQNDARGDIKLASQSVLGDIRKGEKHRMSAQAFSHNRNAPPSSGAQPTASRTTSAQSNTPQPQENSAGVLNAAAPEFKPVTANTNGTARTPATANTGQEDGELKDERKHTGTSTTGPEQRGRDREPNRPPPAPVESRSSAPTQRNDDGANSRGAQKDVPSAATPSQLPVPPVPRPESRGNQGHPGPASRVAHTLPPRPEPQQHRGRALDRVNDRQADYGNPNRIDSRSNGGPEFGRVDRSGEPQREPFGERRDLSPGRRRPRSHERREPGWVGRDIREPRDIREFHDDRTMRPPPRDVRPTPPSYHMRDARDIRDNREPRDLREPRDPRERDARGPPPPLPIDGRPRMHPQGPMNPEDSGGYRRDFPPQSQQGGDRTANHPPRHGIDRPPINGPPPAAMRPGHGNDRAMVNPERAALINDDRPRNERFRSERDTRHERARSRSPRREGHERGPDSIRDRREDRPNDRFGNERVAPHGYVQNRDGRDEPPGAAPTGPRSGRNEPPPSARVPRDIFMGPSAPSRPAAHQAQDPNYGRLNPPVEPIPSAPRSYNNADRRDTARREQAEQSQPPVPSGPQIGQNAGPPPRAGIHPSRLANINAPPIQTDMSNAPSGPRGPGRAPTGPTTSSPSTNRGPPTGPASSERNTRNQGGHALRTINSVLGQNQTPDSPVAETAPPSQPPQVRGRGSTRASGFVDAHNMPSPVGSSSHPSTPNASRPDGPPMRPEHTSGRTDNRIQDDGRYESRGHRESRRNDRHGRQRSRSPDRGDRRVDERSSRNGPADKVPRSDEERASDRDRGQGRDKRGSDREGSRRGRDREGDHSARDGRERRDRSGREDPRGPGVTEDMSTRRGAPPAVGEPPVWNNEGRADPRGADTRHRGDRRRDEPRDTRGDSGRKRRAPEDPNAHQEIKRRRSNI